MECSGFQAAVGLGHVGMCQMEERKFMEEDQNALSEDVIKDDEEAVDGGLAPGDAEEQGDSTAEQGLASDDDPYGVKKRLGMQAKKHQREIRALHDRIAQMHQSMMDSAHPNNATYQPDPYPSPGQPMPPGMTEEEKIQHAVRLALGMKEHEERKVKEAQKMAHVQKQYSRLNDEFDRASDKYDDFDEVVRGHDVPFTNDIRDLLLFVENPAEVAYKLGKNRKELERISQLHPIDMAREINKLSFALMGGNNGKPANTHKNAPMGTIRANPAHSSTSITDKTPASVIRARMKAGTFK